MSMGAFRGRGGTTGAQVGDTGTSQEHSIGKSTLVDPDPRAVARMPSIGKSTLVESELHMMTPNMRGTEARPLAASIRGPAEQSLGIDLGGVRVHQGTVATAANHELGSRAFAHGQDIVLGAGVANDANPIMAHELAHVAQQRGGTPNVAPKLERGSAGSDLEAEADAAAPRILAGLSVRISPGAERVMCFEGDEHMAIGNAAFGGTELTLGKVLLPAGAFTALQGDFFETFDDMQRACNEQPKLVYDFYRLLEKQCAARTRGDVSFDGAIMVASKHNGRDPTYYTDLAAKNFNHFSERNVESRRLFAQSMERSPAYAVEIARASKKFGHNVAQWLEMHLDAGKRAYQAGLNGESLGGVSLAMEAAALHYLTDAFAAGHMRVPRLEMYLEYQMECREFGKRSVDARIPDEIDIVRLLRPLGPPLIMPSLEPLMRLPSISLVELKARIHAKARRLGDAVGETLAGASTMVLHSEDNANGIMVSNENKQSWRAMGDHHLACSDENQKVVTDCAKASAKHIRDLHARGQASAGRPAKPELPYIPLSPIIRLLPQASKGEQAKDTEPGGSRDWHLSTMSDGYRARMRQTLRGSLTSAIYSAGGEMEDIMIESVRGKVRDAFAGLGLIASLPATAIASVVRGIMNALPTQQQIMRDIVCASGMF